MNELRNYSFGIYSQLWWKDLNLIHERKEHGCIYAVRLLCVYRGVFHVNMNTIFALHSSLTLADICSCTDIHYSPTLTYAYQLNIQSRRTNPSIHTNGGPCLYNTQLSLSLLMYWRVGEGDASTWNTGQGEKYTSGTSSKAKAQHAWG